ncbi:trypsin-like serine peptidase, partial [Halocola ammonii]
MRFLTSAFVWIILFSISHFSAQAQISSGGLPLSFTSELPGKQSIPTERMPDFDLEKLKAEDEVREQHKDIPFRFAFLHEVEFSLSSHGEWTSLENGIDVWRIRIISGGAHSLNFTYKNFNLPKGSKLFVLNPQTRQYIGAFTEKNNKFDGIFSTTPVAGDDIILELQVPSHLKSEASMTIATVAHDYKGIFKLAAGFGDSGACNNNVVCPLWNPWDDQIRSVALITTNFGSAICSGSLINNTANDGTPYFLTANHCLVGNPSTWNFIFNYESPNCNPSSNGSFSNSISNATLLASGGSADYALMQLSSTPPSSYNVFYAGWDATGNTPQEQVGIHHPSGDVKKISLDDDSGLSAVWGGAQTWRVQNWEDGTTEGGSSGSPLFDQNKRIVGQLYGGQAACNFNFNDYYGKFSVTYPNVCQWLAPGCNTLVLDGYDPDPDDPDDGGGDNGSGNLLDLGVAEVVEPIGNTCINEIEPQVVIENFGDVTITEADIVYSFDGGNDQVLAWTGSLEAGETELVTLPTIVVNAGGHTFSVDALNPNGFVDQIPSNNGEDTDFTVGSVEYTMEIITDQFGSETSWELRNIQGQVVAQGGPYEDQASPGEYPQPIETVCLSTSCYGLYVFDQGGNGMCCSAGNGSYTFTDNQGNVVESGSNFGPSDVNTICPDGPIPGCTDASACNFDPDATEDDGSCILIGDSCDDGLASTSNDTINEDCVCEGTEAVLGCTDSNACNYDPNAEEDDGSCLFTGDSCDDGDATTGNDIITENCECEGETVPGCTNSNACNYDPNATVDDGSCLIQGESCDDGDPTTVGDLINFDCECEGIVVPGCTDSNACNYNPTASVDDGSCLFTGDSCDDGNPETVDDTIDENCQCGGNTVPGCTDSNACNYDPNATVNDGSCLFTGDSCDDGNATTINDVITENCDCEGETVPGCTNINACNYNPNATVNDGSCLIVGETCDDGDPSTVNDVITADCNCEGETIPGCTNINACNYNPNATVNDGSCLFTGDSCDDGDPETVDDTIDENCQCGGNTIPGCTDSNACNYNPNATVDDGSCLIVGVTCDDGNASTINDVITENCECEGETVPGCTNINACNYDPDATVNDGSCLFTGDSCDDGDPETVNDTIDENC